jgi:hypothetical protein
VIKYACTAKHGGFLKEVMFHCVHESKEKETLTDGAREEDIAVQLAAYLAFCRERIGGASGVKRGGSAGERSFPNMAGFCRWLGGGISLVERLREADPEGYDLLCATLEDEALNSSVSPTLLSAYLKRRLGYADKEEGGKKSTEAECEQIRLVFDHDIMEDGK